MSTPRKRKESVTPSGRSNKKRARPTGLTETEPEAEINREISNLTEGNNIKYNNLLLFKKIFIYLFIGTQEGTQEETQEGIQGTQRGIQEEIFPEGRTRNLTLDKLISQNAEVIKNFNTLNNKIDKLEKIIVDFVNKREDISPEFIKVI
jgi:hypothetical protein